MSDELRRTKALVVGGSGPLGRAIAVALAEAGADVCVASLTKERDDEFATNSVANELWALRGSGRAFVVDAGDFAQLDGAVDAAAREMGGVTLVVVNGPPAVAEAAERVAGPGVRLIVVRSAGDEGPETIGALVVQAAQSAGDAPAMTLHVDGPGISGA